MFATAVLSLSLSSTLGQDYDGEPLDGKSWWMGLRPDEGSTSKTMGGRRVLLETRLFDNRCTAFVKTNTGRSILMVVQFYSSLTRLYY